MPSLHFKTYLPSGTEIGKVEFERLRPDMYRNLYGRFKRDMLAAQRKPKEGERSFQSSVESNISDKPIAFQFVWKSDTSAIIIWARPTGEGEVPDLQGVSAFMTRLDPAGGKTLLDKIKANPRMAGIASADYQDAGNDPHPLAATFFVNKEAAEDSLIHALVTMATSAFFDQFGMADPEHVVRIQFQGSISIPEDSAEALDLKELVIPDEEAQALFREFDDSIKQGTGFSTTIPVHGDDERPTTIRFNHVGQTAAFFMLSYDVDGEPKHIHGLTALLPKLDAAEDRQVINHVRRFAAFGGIKQESFDRALEVDHPVAATFFADIGSANYPPLYSLIKILSAAFFSQFGIGSEEA